MKKIMISLVAVIFATFSISISAYGQETGTMTDSRDSLVYKTVKIGEQWWMAENLRYQPSKKFATKQDYGRMLMRDKDTGKAYVVTYVSYANDESNVATYGYLYDGETACTVCSDGWHLPTFDEWEILINYLDKTVAGTKMKETEGTYWETSKTKIEVTNSSGFSALPGGHCTPNLAFSGLGEYAFFWAHENNKLRFIRLDKKKNSITVASLPIEYLFSVRCIKD